MASPFFRDRQQAGMRLADSLKAHAGQKNTIVLALPRGGVPVGFAVAKALSLPLDVLLVRKLGLPGHEEFAMGAVASGGVKVLSQDTLSRFHVPEQAIEIVLQREMKELERRERKYRAGRSPLVLKGRTAILVDDGLATGSTMLAAVASLKQREVARIVAAVPVGAQEACEKIAQAVNEVICLYRPEPFYAVSPWYEEFGQTTDEEVVALLSASDLQQ